MGGPLVRLPEAGREEFDARAYPHTRVDQCDRPDRSRRRGEHLQRHGSAERGAEDADRLVVNRQPIAQRGQRGRELVSGLVDDRGQVGHQRVDAGTVREAVYPVVGEKTLRELVAEAKANESVFRAQVRTVLREQTGSAVVELNRAVAVDRGRGTRRRPPGR